MVICPVCADEHNNKKFCSRSCSNKARTRNLKVNICKGCGVEFNGYSKYCNNDCYQKCRYRSSHATKKEISAKKVTNHRKRLKIKAVDYLGGKCDICGYDKCIAALEFHHKDPEEKDFGISAKGVTRRWDIVKVELDKCILLCSNCHREVHAGLVEINR